MMDFSFGGVGLAPHHYVEIKKNPLFALLGSQEQRLLILKPGDADLFLNLNLEKKKEKEETANLVEKPKKPKAEKVEELDPRFYTERDLVRKVNPMLPVFGLLYKDVKTAWDLLPEEQFTQIVWLGEDDKDLFFIHQHLFNRWKSPEEIDGHLFVSKSGSCESIVALAVSLQSYHISILPTFSTEKKEEAVWALTLAAVNAQLAISPQKPYTQVPLTGLEAPLTPPTLLQRDRLLVSGVSTIRTNGKQVILDRLVTTQSKEDDPCFRDVNTKQILSYLRYDLKQYFSTIFSRMSLARDDFAYSGDVITPKAAKALVIARFRKWQEQSLVQDPEERFSKDVRVEVDAKNPTKLNFYLPVVVMGQLYTTQTQICFSL